MYANVALLLCTGPEFDGIPEAELMPMNDIVDELWIPSRYNRDIFIGDGVTGSKVKVPVLHPMLCPGPDAEEMH